MKRWQMSMALAGTALGAALLAPQLFPLLKGEPLAEPVSVLPVQQIEPIEPIEPVQEASEPRTIDLVIAIDTSGSMERLIDSTRARLWDIVNEIDSTDPDATLRVGLMAYGSPSFGEANGYVKVVMPLTEDLDALYTAAWGLKTNGGEEYVGAVIQHAVNDLDWSPRDNPENRRLLFVAGNETAALGPISYHQSTGRAVQQGILVSTLFAGEDQAGRTLQWAKVAAAGHGRYVAIDARRSAVATSTPYDQQLESLNGVLNTTYVAGSSSGQARYQQMLVNDRSSESYGSGGLASRVASKSSAKFKTGSWDIVDQQDQGTLDFGGVDKNALPADLRNLDNNMLGKALEKKSSDRKRVKRQIQRVQEERGRYLRQKSAAEDGDGLDEAMAEILTDLL